MIKLEKIKKLRPKLLLHVCCANCLNYPAEILSEDYQVSLYFYNPNIQPAEEYKKRLHEVRRISGMQGIDLIEEYYDSFCWEAGLTSEFKNEPEGGRRCTYCFENRLNKTAEFAKSAKFDCFASTLTVSPHKNAEIINLIGRNLEKKYSIKFFEADFKKKD